MLKKNLIANYLGQGWVALMGLAFIPVYIKYLGIESYGLIGLFTLMQAWLSLLDMGMTPTLGREMARFTGGGHSPQSIRDLLRSIEIIALIVSLFIAVGIALCANMIATFWLQIEAVPVDVVEQALMIIGMVTAIRFMESIYRSSIIGLQRQVLFNKVNSLMATLRGLGAVCVLIWVSASIKAFFIWQGLVSIATLISLVVITYANLPHAERDGKFSLVALRDQWKFAGGMLGITFLSLLLTQVDKVLLSKLVSLSEYGYYTLAGIVAGALYVVINPITQAYYPRLCELNALNDQAGLVETYHRAAQLVSVFAGSLAIVVIMFAETFLFLWTRNSELTERTGTLLRLLMLGNLLNGLMWIPYQTQLAHGWTSLSVRINIVAIAVIVPAIILVTPYYGAEGAAVIWVVLNMGYAIIGVQFMYKYIIVNEKMRWYVQDVLKPLLSALAVVGLIKIFWPIQQSLTEKFAVLTIAFICAMQASILGSDQIQKLYKSKLKL